MKKKIQIIIISSLFFTSICLAQQTDKIITQQVDSLINDAYEKGLFSGEVIIAHNNENIYYKQLGYADWNTKKPIVKNTLFNIGSLNKQFTEEIIHQLVGENKLNYSDNLSKYLNIFPVETGSKITVQQLLDMKAGLVDYLQDPKFDKIQFTDFSMTQLIDIIKTESLLFEPGTNQEYSNSGYVVLGALIEKITQLSYETNLRNRIAKPLKLENIFYSKAEKARQKNRAYGTEIDFECQKISFDDIANSTPAGGTYTDINSLLKFAEAKMNSALPSGIKYGSGIFAGGTPFWNTTIYYNEKNGYAFVVMTNTGNIADELAPRIKSIIKNEPFPPIELPFNITLYKTINEKGIAYVKDHAEALAEQARLPYDARFFNFFGYQFLEGKKLDIAISLFKINVELFPTVANTYDSLAEAYLKSGDKMNALKYYKIELQMEPNNEKVKSQINLLENKK
jgi:CubicO group peptidase (beta-lactamase class C family)